MVNPMSDELSRRGDPTSRITYFVRWPFKTDIYVPATRAADQDVFGILGLLNDYPG